jgi:hypothetical protein
VIDQVVFDWAPVAIALVVGCFFAEYTLTHVGARASELVRDRWRVEGSYEMNPVWERQIDSRRWFGPRVLLVPLALAGILSLLRLLAGVVDLYADPAYFALGVGTMLLIQAPILMLHAANLQTFLLLADPTAAAGGIVYRRWFVYRQGIVYLAGFAVLWLLLWVPSQQAFFLGGVLSCGVFAGRLAQLAKAARMAPPTAAGPEVPAVYDSATES